MREDVANLPAKLIAAANRCRKQHLPLQERKGIAAELLVDDPRQSNGIVAWGTLLSAPTVRRIRLGLERRGEIEAGARRIDRLGRVFPATQLPNRGRLAGTETMAMRAVARAIGKVGALRTLEIVIAQLPAAVDLATTPYSAIECENLALHVGSRAPTTTRTATKEGSQWRC